MSVSSVPPIQFTQTGIVLPAESDILAGVQADIDAAFGGGTNPALETPQGQLATSQAAVVADKNNEFAYFLNQIDPQYADGRFQDAIARIYFLTRKGATATVVSCTLYGLPGTLIPAGTLARDTTGNVYVNEGNVIIGLSGNATGNFQNVQTGPIPCAAGTLTSVYQAISGWSNITNGADGIQGRLVESRADFEYRRKNSVAINAEGTLAAIYANVFNVANVLDVYAIDNVLDTSATVGATSYSMAPHSLYVAVIGGLDADIANAIWTRKDLGCNYNGNSSVTVTDPSGYSYPQPSYVVKFNRPAALPIKFAVQIVNNSALPSNIVALVKSAIIARFNGTDGSTRERIGSNIFASRYYGAVSAVANSVSILSILIGTSSPTLSTISVGIDQGPTLSASDIAVTLV